MKLACSTWGASANTLPSSALALYYSAAEYCAPVWSRSARTSQVDVAVQLNSAIRLISGTLNLHLSHGFQCCPTLNRRPYEGRLPLTSWWRKSSNMTVSQSSLISFTHHCYDWHPGSRCGWTCNQLTSTVDGSCRLRWSILTECATPQSGNRVLTSVGNIGLCRTVFARNRYTAVPAEGNGDLQTLICVLEAWPRRCRCPTLSNPVLWQNWMVVYLSYTLQIKTPFRGWPIMGHDTHTGRRRRLGKQVALMLQRGRDDLEWPLKVVSCTVNGFNVSQKYSI